MTIVGMILFAIGGAAALLFYVGMAPAFLQGTPITMGTCLIVAVIGAVLMILGRRPAD